MRTFLLFCLFSIRALHGAEKEVRSYRVDESALLRAHYSVYEDPFKDANSVDHSEQDWLGKVVKKAPFGSRFLKGKRKLRDCSVRVGEIIGEKSFDGQAVYDEEARLLVVKAGEKHHRSIRGALEHRLLSMIRTEVSIYRIPKVKAKMRPLLWKEAPKGAEFLTSLLFVHLPGQSVESLGAGGKVRIELETQIDSNDPVMENRMSLWGEFPEADFEWLSGFSWVEGVPLVQEVGSLDGKMSVCVVVEQSLILKDGTLRNEWILKEEGGAILFEERLADWLPKEHQDNDGEDSGTVVRRFTVPPTFETFLLRTYEGKAAKSGEKEEGSLDIKKLLADAGIRFREGDSATFLRESSTLIVKVSEANMELVDLLVNAGRPGPPRMVRLDFWEVEGGPEDSDNFWKAEGSKISRKIGHTLFPGQPGTIRLGKDLALEAEVQIDANDEVVEVRATLSQLGGDLKKAAFKTGMTLHAGQPVLVHESREGDLRKAWVIRAEVIKMEEEVAAWVK
ncbi:MAG: hypothetical protein ACON4R_12240 [Akkermansiaceae bacterium]